MDEDQQKLPRLVTMLGYTGLLPQAFALYLIAAESEWRWVAAACAFAYAALILSFLGGAWWGGAIQRQEKRSWPFAVAVLPSLIGLALYIPWTLGGEWPAPGLIAMGLWLAMSPIVDHALGYGPSSWLTLRRNLSIGLGALTFITGLLV